MIDFFFDYGSNHYDLQGIKRGFGEEEASFSPAKSFRPDDKDIPLRDRFREDRGGRGGRESRWGKQEENNGGRKPPSGSNPPAGIPDEGGKNANLKPLGARKPRGGRGGANTGETMQGEHRFDIKFELDFLRRKVGSNGWYDCTFA